MNVNDINNDPVGVAPDVFTANRRYQTLKYELGLKRVNSVVADVDGDCLEPWGEEFESLPLFHAGEEVKL